MGRDKAMLDLGGQPLILRQVEILSGVADEVLIASGRTRRYAGLGARVVLDRLLPACALAGVHAVLDSAKTEVVFICACDHPCL
ncbi:MAG TPA: NTP transferase domain-containing protein, partial [Planctomycetota bacterium]|nr:NTP transferase domain-containing protein [Planctomycetota bacterium]